MTTVLLLVQMFVTLALIAVVLVQRSEGGGLGIGSSQGMGSFMGGRGTANLLTRTTAILGAVFFGLSLVLALLNRGTAVNRSVLDDAPPPAQTTPARPVPGAPSPAAPSPAAPGPLVPGQPTPAPAAQAPAPTAPAPAAPVPAPRAPSVPTN